jgi:hypothetical protein
MEDYGNRGNPRNGYYENLQKILNTNKKTQLAMILLNCAKIT